MSDVIKLNPRTQKTGVKIAAIGSSADIQSEAESAKKLLDEYYERGFKEGYEKAKKDAERELSDKLFRKYEEMHRILQQFDESFADYEISFEKLVISTAFEVAKKIIQRELGEQTVINENVKSAVVKVMGANEVRLKLNPSDIDELNTESKNLLNGNSFNKIKIEPDERIEQGGCLIETEIGSVDARISTQLNEIQKLLEDNLIKKN